MLTLATICLNFFKKREDSHLRGEFPILYYFSECWQGNVLQFNVDRNYSIGNKGDTYSIVTVLLKKEEVD